VNEKASDTLRKGQEGGCHQLQTSRLLRAKRPGEKHREKKGKTPGGQFLLSRLQADPVSKRQVLRKGVQRYAIREGPGEEKTCNGGKESVDDYQEKKRITLPVTFMSQVFISWGSKRTSRGSIWKKKVKTKAPLEELGEKKGYQHQVGSATAILQRVIDARGLEKERQYAGKNREMGGRLRHFAGFRIKRKR